LARKSILDRHQPPSAFCADFKGLKFELAGNNKDSEKFRAFIQSA
jgi:hypothetical protein